MGESIFSKHMGGEARMGGKANFTRQGGGNFNFLSIIICFYQFITDIIYNTWCPDIYFLYFVPNGTFW